MRRSELIALLNPPQGYVGEDPEVVILDTVSGNQYEISRLYYIPESDMIEITVE